MTERILSREETRLKTRKLVEGEVNRRFAHLPRPLRKKLAREGAKEILASFPGQRMVIQYAPKNVYQRLKLRFAPKSFIDRFPVKYTESN